LGPLRHSGAALTAAVGLPVFAAGLALRPAWRRGWRERLGAIDVDLAGAGVYWVHAASAGETCAARPLLAALLERGDRAVLTHTRASALDWAVAPAGAAQLDGRALAPLDHPWSVGRALGRIDPRAIVLIETELWPVAIREASRRGVAVGAASATISERSFWRYRRWQRLLRPTFERLAFVGARTEADAERFRALGARPDRVRTTGDLKLDGALHIPSLPAAIEGALGKAPLLVAGSTHEGEEAAALAALALCAGRDVAARLVIAPRRVERAGAVVRAVEQAGLRARRRSAWSNQRQGPLEPDEVVVLDRPGELVAWYAAATVAFVGGTLLPVGGHNLYEPVQAGAFVLHGPHTSSVDEAARLLTEVAAAERVADAAALGEAAARWLAQPDLARAGAQRGASALAARSGAAQRTLDWIDAALARGAAR
jgi:3-deoxy-D-manno-octulosonic-acid transferase